jgi:CubicO group peptidase (beta-lactamase class C family)
VRTVATPGRFTRPPTAAIVAVLGLAVLGGLMLALAVRTPARPVLVHVPENHRWFLPQPPITESADALVRDAVAQRTVPGATLAIGRGASFIELAGYGRLGWTERDPLVSADSTIYDLASMTKALATVTAVFLLVQDGKIALDDVVQRRLPAFRGKWKEKVTWRHLLTHTSGLRPSATIRGSTPKARLAGVLREPLTTPPGNHVEYSDIGFIVLYAAAERVAGEPLPRLLKRRVWLPLGMRSTSFWPGTACTRCAPTETLRSGKPYRGEPSDPIAHALGVPTGNAGLFSTAPDVGRFAAMIANGGELNGVRILRSDLVAALAEQVPGAGHRTLGWEAFCEYEHLTQQQPCQKPVAFGHTGWTGTSFWIDPASHSWVVILSNRTYDVKRPPSLDSLRAVVFARADEIAAPSR